MCYCFAIYVWGICVDLDIGMDELIFGNEWVEFILEGFGRFANRPYIVSSYYVFHLDN